MRILDITLKDLSQVLRDRRSLLFLVAMPIVFTLFMGFAYKDGSEQADPRLSLGWVNNDPQGLLSQQLHDELAASDSLRLVEIPAAEASDAAGKVTSGELAAILTVPQGFSEQALANQSVQLSLTADELSTTGQSVFQLVRVPVTRLMGSVEVAQLAVEAIDHSSQGLSQDEQAQEVQMTFKDAFSSWTAAAQSGAQIVIEKAAHQSKSEPFGGNPYNQSSPGIMVQFAIFGLVTTANILVQERKTRTIQRMITTSMSPAAIIAGHMLAYFLLTLFQQVFLVAFGQLVLKVNYFREPLAILVVMVTVSLWVASMGLLVSVLAKAEQQVTLYSLITMFVLSALGGAWFPLEGSGSAFASIARLTPGAWAMNGFQNILIRGLDFSSSLLPAGILLAYALGFFLLAVWLFGSRREA